MEGVSRARTGEAVSGCAVAGRSSGRAGRSATRCRGAGRLRAAKQREAADHGQPPAGVDPEHLVKLVRRRSSGGRDGRACAEQDQAEAHGDQVPPWARPCWRVKHDDRFAVRSEAWVAADTRLLARPGGMAAVRAPSGCSGQRPGPRCDDPGAGEAVIPTTDARMHALGLPAQPTLDRSSRPVTRTVLGQSGSARQAVDDAKDPLRSPSVRHDPHLTGPWWQAGLNSRCPGDERVATRR